MVMQRISRASHPPHTLTVKPFILFVFNNCETIYSLFLIKWQCFICTLVTETQLLLPYELLNNDVNTTGA